LHEWFIPAADFFGSAATAAARGAIGGDAFNARHAARSIVIFVIIVVTIIVFFPIVVTLVIGCCCQRRWHLRRTS